MKSVTLKEIERRSDGVVFPTDPREDLTVVEFQFHEDSTIYCRTAIEMAQLQQEQAMRGVQGIIFFRSSDIDPQTEPWRHVIRSIPLRETLEELSVREPSHPLVAVFRPVLLRDEETLAQRAANYYNQIRSSELAENVKFTLLDVFVNWLESLSNRFRRQAQGVAGPGSAERFSRRTAMVKHLPNLLPPNRPAR